MNKILLSILLTVLLTGSNLVFAAVGDIVVKIDGKQVTFPDAKPYIQTESNRTMVPIRFIAENLGCKVDWNQNLREVSIKKEYKEIRMCVGETEALINNKPKNLDAPPIIKENRTFVPLRFISENLNAKVEWLDSLKVVDITTFKEDPKSFIEPKISVQYAISKDEANILEIQLDNWGDYSSDYDMKIHFTSHPINESEFLNIDDKWYKSKKDDWCGGICDTIFQLHRKNYTTRENAFELKEGMELKYVFYLKKISTGEIKEYPGSVIVKIPKN